MGITVQELIEILQKIEDKSLPIKICTNKLACSIRKVARAKTSSAVLTGKDISYAIVITA